MLRAPIGGRFSAILGTTVLIFTLASLAFNFQEQPQSVKDGRFEFAVIESFDAKYLGDTPGHRGRNGGLGNVQPHISLGDPVYRGDTRVGQVTLVLWDRPKSSLEIEFDPAPLQNISVGDMVAVVITPPAK